MEQELIFKLRLSWIFLAAIVVGIMQVEGLQIAVNAEQQMTLLEGTQMVALNCPITGAIEPITYRWFHNAQGQNETQIAVSTASYILGRSALTITAVMKTDQGDFRAEVTDAAGGSGTCKFILNVAYPPQFVNLPPPEIYVNLSQAFQLDCLTEGNPTPTIEWLKDGAKLGNRNNIQFLGSKLLFLKIETFDRGSYQCNATNEYGENISPSTLIYVDVPLTFTSTPESVMLLRAGENITLECNITGYPHPIISWYKDNYILNNDYHRIITRVYSELVSWSHLTFTNIKYTDSGIYTCEAQNRNQAIAFGTEMIVQVLPQITTHHPKGMVIHIGDPFKMECRATGIPPPTYKWFHNGKPISDADFHFETNKNEGTLTIKESLGTDAGEYFCRVVNSVGEVNSAVTQLYIDGLHFLKKPPAVVYILEGSSKQLECQVAGSKNTMSVEWYKNQMRLDPICPPGASFSECPIELQGNTLLLNEVGLEQEGAYMCVAKEMDGPDPKQIRARSIVQIMVPPSFARLLPSVIEGRRMGQLSINCTAIGKPAPHIDWLKQGVRITSDTYREVRNSVLYFNELHTRHNGKYTCAASNEAGTKTQVVRVHVNCNSSICDDKKEEKPEVKTGPATLNATVTVSSWTATVSWVVKQSNGYEIHHFEMEYQEMSPVVMVWIAVGGNIPGDARKYTLTGLNANTTYQLHMWAVNTQGIGEILTQEFTTLPADGSSSPLAGNNLVVMVSAVSVIACVILLLVVIILARKNSQIWYSKKQEDGHSLMNNQHDSPSSGSHVNPAFNEGAAGKQPKGMEMHDVSNYGSTTLQSSGGAQETTA